MLHVLNLAAAFGSVPYFFAENHKNSMLFTNTFSMNLIMIKLRSHLYIDSAIILEAEREGLFMKKNIWLIVAILLVITFATLQAVNNANANKADRGEVKSLDAEALEKIVNQADFGKVRRSTGVKAPKFTLKSLDGSYVSIGGKSAKPIVLNFWASWCDACSVEAMEMRKLYEQYKDQIDFYGINVTSEEKSENIKAFIAKNNLHNPILLDEHKHAADLYELHALPTMFLIDKDGYIIDTFHMVDPLELAEKIGRLAKNETY